MTSDFDNLMSIHSMAKENPKFAPLAEWLADLCVTEADTREPNWNFKTWLTKDSAQVTKKLYGEGELKWDYLNDCHDVLDHKSWHLRVFQPDTQSLIRFLHDLMRGREQSKQEMKKLFKKRHLPKLMELLQAYGLEDDKYFVKLKGVERTKDF